MLRPRIADGPAGRRLWARSGRDPIAQRDADGRSADHRSAGGERGARSSSASSTPRRCRCPVRPTTTSWRCRVARAGRPIPVTSCAASAGAWRSRTSCTPKGSTTTRRPGAGSPTVWPRSSSPRPRSGQGFVDDRRSDRPVDPRRRRGRARPHRHPGRIGRIHVGFAADVDERGSGRRGVSSGAGAVVRGGGGGERARRTAARRRGHRRGRRGVGLAASRSVKRPPASRSTRRSSTAIRRRRISTSSARATATRRSRSSPTGRWSMSTRSWAS